MGRARSNSLVKAIIAISLVAAVLGGIGLSKRSGGNGAARVSNESKDARLDSVSSTKDNLSPEEEAERKRIDDSGDRASSRIDSDTYVDISRAASDSEYAKRIRRHRAIATYLAYPHKGHPEHQELLRQLLASGYDIEHWLPASRVVLKKIFVENRFREDFLNAGMSLDDVEARMVDLPNQIPYLDRRRRMLKDIGISESSLVEDILNRNLPFSITDSMWLSAEQLVARNGDQILSDEHWLTPELAHAKAAYTGPRKPVLSMEEIIMRKRMP